MAQARAENVGILGMEMYFPKRVSRVESDVEPLES